MNRLASRLSSMNVIRKEHPLNNDELMHAVPGIFSEDKHDSRSDSYTHIPTITVLDKLREEGFLPFFACQTRTHDEGKRGHTKHMMRLCRAGQIAGAEVPEIILLNSHDGSSNYQMIPDRLLCFSRCGWGNILCDFASRTYRSFAGIFLRVQDFANCFHNCLDPHRF